MSNSENTTSTSKMPSLDLLCRVSPGMHMNLLTVIVEAGL
jgi:hypothetical protein